MAKRFTFRFETMLKIRREREDRHKRIVADRIREIQQIQERLGALGQQIEQEVNAMRSSAAPGVLNMQQIVHHRHWLGHLNKNILDEGARLRFLEARLAQERAALAEAAKQRKVLDKLRERQEGRYIKEQGRREMQELDEMATTRFAYDGANENI
jgi:flagellar protein FliJ